MTNLIRQFYKDETDQSWINEQGEPDLDYVIWLENKLKKYIYEK
jgi:hypothetical protein